MLCEKERYVDMLESTPSYNKTEHMRGRLTHKARKFKCLCKERCMGKPKSTPSHKANERTRGRLT